MFQTTNQPIWCHEYFSHLDPVGVVTTLKFTRRPSNHKLCPNEHPSTLKSSNMPIGKSPKMVILMGQWMNRSFSIAMFDYQRVYPWQWSYTEKKPQLYLNWLEFPTPPICVLISCLPVPFSELSWIPHISGIVPCNHGVPWIIGDFTWIIFTWGDSPARHVWFSTHSVCFHEYHNSVVG